MISSPIKSKTTSYNFTNVSRYPTSVNNNVGKYKVEIVYLATGCVKKMPLFVIIIPLLMEKC
jgi:hypothetical protein